MVGVTTFIKHSLLGTKFARRSKGKARTPRSRNVHSRGLNIGRKIDAAFNRHISGEDPYQPANPKQARLGHIIGALRRRGIELVRAQVPVARRDLGITTTIDALAVTKAGEVVVVELKSTQFTSSEHKLTYNEPCLLRPVLSNGFQSSEKNMHLLQAAFGVVACRSVMNVEVRGVVVVSYTDSAVVHNVPEAMCNTLHFAGAGCCAPAGTRNPRPSASRKRQRFDPWPSEDERVGRVLRSHGAHGVRSNGRCNVVCATTHGGEPAFVAGCIASKWSAVRAGEKKLLTAALLKSNLDVFGKSQSQMYVLSPHGQHWRLFRIKQP